MHNAQLQHVLQQHLSWSRGRSQIACTVAIHSCKCDCHAVLGVSLLLEGYSLLVAVRTVTAGAASHGLSFTEFVKRGMDPTSIAVMMEDGAACAGLVIAGQLPF